MKLKSDSSIIKWAYFMVDTWDMPDRTNVCALFWRCFLLTPLKLVVMGGLLAIMWPLLLWHYIQTNPRFEWLWKPRVIVIPEFRLPSLPGRGLGRVAVQRVRDWKSGVCTIVEIE